MRFVIRILLAQGQEDARSTASMRHPVAVGPRWWWTSGDRVPGDVLLHPVALGAVALLLVNDHVLKRVWPGFVTGKLSDVAAMVFCPLLIASVVEIVRAAARRRRVALSAREALAVCLVVAVGFTAMKLSPEVASFYGRLVGTLRAVGGGGVREVQIAPDPTDAFTSVGVVLSLILLNARQELKLRHRSV